MQIEKSDREAARLAALDYLDAVQPEADGVLQELVDEVRSIFGTALCMVNLILSDVQYFRAWSGDLPADLAEARRDPRDRSMCQYVVETEMPLVVCDFLATEEFKDQHFFVNYGFRFYAGAPLITSEGHAIGDLCLLDNRPNEFSEEQTRILEAFARAVVGRLELLGALRREQAAKEREARHHQELQRTLDNSLDMFAILANVDDRKFESVSRASKTILGYEPEQIIGLSFVDLVHPDDRELSAKAIADITNGASIKRFENRCRHKDGSTVWIEWSIQYLSEEDSVYCVGRDVTERKRAEEAHAVLVAIVNSSDDAIIGKTLDGTITSWNLGAQRMYGYSSEEAVGQSISMLVPPELPNEIPSILEKIRRGESVEHYETERIGKDGRRLYVSITVSPIKDSAGRIVGASAIARDITERRLQQEKEAELLVREQVARAEAEAVQARLAIILNNLTEGVLMAEPQGHILFANPAACAMLGATSAEPLEELPDPWGDFHLPEAVAHCAKSGERVEARVRYGETFLRIKLEYLAGVDKNLGDVLVVMQDLSEGRRLEANQQRFLANAAHQLKTPIMAILGAAELLATGDDADPAIRRPLLNHVFSEGRRMQRLSETLLRLSRIGWDRREPSLEIVDLSEAGQQAAERMAPLAENMGLRVLVEGETAYVRADPEWLQEVLLVLLSNAIKHSNRGGDIRVRVAGNTLTVEDEGAGINPADLPHVFERFYRGKDSSEGFGLGLSICRELTDRMGGDISIRSREGVGTAVKIELPEVEADA
jgi:PAS domain S-box-containing protein